MGRREVKANLWDLTPVTHVWPRVWINPDVPLSGEDGERD